MSANARIKVVGVGGAGVNAVNKMMAAGFTGVEFIAANTDVQALSLSAAPIKLQLGAKVTRGLGAGQPDVGRRAVLEDTEQIIEVLDGADVVFVVVGLGGGTGTGAGPVIASLASELGALTIAVVCKPFTFEGKRRQAQAERGLVELREGADIVIAISNERLLSRIDRSMSLADAFSLADDALRQAVQGISDLVLSAGPITVGLPDLRAFIAGRGTAVVGSGMAEGENRAVEAAKRALSSPLLEDAFSDARAVIISVTGGEDMSLADVRAASSVIHEAAAEDASIIFGAAVDARLNGKINVTVVAKGVSDEAPQVKKTVDDSAETADPGSVILVWNPEVVSPDDYATVVEALGNLVRAEGAAGLRRIAHGTHNISLVDRVLQ